MTKLIGMQVKAVICIVFSLMSGLSAQAKDRGDPPDGFSWYESQEAQVAIPLPVGWHSKMETVKGTLGIFLSEQNIDQSGRFRTGFTLNYRDNFSTDNATGPTEYAARYIAAAEQTQEVVLEPWLTKLADGISGLGIRILDLSTQPATIVHYYLIADEIDDTLRVSIFEATESDWDTAWQLGKVMLTDMKLWR